MQKFDSNITTGSKEEGEVASDIPDAPDPILLKVINLLSNIASKLFHSIADGSMKDALVQEYYMKN